MEAKTTRLHFKASLKNTSDKAIMIKNLMVQYFDLEKNSWIIIEDDLMRTSGKLDHAFDLAELEKKNPAAYVNFKAAMSGNIIPALRLIDGATIKDEWTVVYSQYPIIYTEENSINLDFGDLWILSENQINRHIKGSHPNNEFAIGAFQRPNGNHALFPALLAGLMHTKSFTDYKPEEHLIKIVTEGEAAEVSRIIEELNLALSNKQAELDAVLELNKELSDKNADEAKADDAADEAGDKLDGEVDGTITDKLKEKLGEKEELKEAYDVDKDGVKALTKIAEARPARDVYTTIVDEVKSASDKLENTPYTLSNISLNLKTHVITDDDGFKLQLIDAETAAKANNGTVSEVKIDIGTKGNATKPSENLVSPNIIGLTETAARQRLKNFGLKMKVIYQMSKTKTVGQAFRQEPVAGNDINMGDTIIAIFAKK